MFFQFQNKAARLNCLEMQTSKKSLSVVYYSFLTDVWPSRFFSLGFKNKLSDAWWCWLK